MQAWSLFIVLGLVTVVFVVLVFRRLPWPRTRRIHVENRWIGSTSIEFEPLPPEQPHALEEEPEAGKPHRTAPELPACRPSPAPPTSEEPPRRVPRRRDRDLRNGDVGHGKS